MRVRLALHGLVVTAIVVMSSPAPAGESVAELAKKLRSADDFRIRTQAALALGASESKDAVKPLCTGLADDKSTVRAAAAAALGKLAKGGKECLETRLKGEDDRNVKKMLRKAVRMVEEGALGPALSKSTKYYVSIDKASATGLSNGTDGDAVVRTHLIKTTSKFRGYVFAPLGETEVQATKRLRKYPNVEGFLFAPKLAVQRSGGTISARLTVDIAGYPQKSPMGQIMRNAGFHGISPDEMKDKETELIERVCVETVEEFDKLASERE